MSKPIFFKYNEQLMSCQNCNLDEIHEEIKKQFNISDFLIADGSLIITDINQLGNKTYEIITESKKNETNYCLIISVIVLFISLLIMYFG